MYFKKSVSDDDDDAGTFADVRADVKANGHKMVKVITFDDDEGGEIVAVDKHGRKRRYEFTGSPWSKALYAAAEKFAKQQAADEFEATAKAILAKKQEKTEVTKERYLPPAAMFEKHVNDVLRRDGGTRQQAMQTARRENPEAFKLWQEPHQPGPEMAAAIEKNAKEGRELAGKADAPTDAFEKAVNDLRKADPKLTRQEAMRAARLEHPDEFGEYQHS